MTRLGESWEEARLPSLTSSLAAARAFDVAWVQLAPLLVLLSQLQSPHRLVAVLSYFEA